MSRRLANAPEATVLQICSELSIAENKFFDYIVHEAISACRARQQDSLLFLGVSHCWTNRSSRHGASSCIILRPNAFSLLREPSSWPERMQTTFVTLRDFSDWKFLVNGCAEAGKEYAKIDRTHNENVPVSVWVKWQDALENLSNAKEYLITKNSFCFCRGAVDDRALKTATLCYSLLADNPQAMVRVAEMVTDKVLKGDDMENGPDAMLTKQYCQIYDSTVGLGPGLDSLGKILTKMSSMRDEDEGGMSQGRIAPPASLVEFKASSGTGAGVPTAADRHRVPQTRVPTLADKMGATRGATLVFFSCRLLQDLALFFEVVLPHVGSPRALGAHQAARDGMRDDSGDQAAENLR